MYDKEPCQLITKLTSQFKLFARMHSALHAARSSENQAIWQPVLQGTTLQPPIPSVQQ